MLSPGRLGYMPEHRLAYGLRHERQVSVDLRLVGLGDDARAALFPERVGDASVGRSLFVVEAFEPAVDDGAAGGAGKIPGFDEIDGNAPAWDEKYAAGEQRLGAALEDLRGVRHRARGVSEPAAPQSPCPHEDDAHVGEFV